MGGADDETRALLSSIWAKRREDVLDRIGVIERALVTAEPSPEQRTEAARQAHMLAGSAGTFGFPLGSELARTIERALESGAPVDDALRATTARLRVELEGEPAP